MRLSSLALWLDDEPHEGPWNMAVDQALLELCQHPVLRIYSWAQPTLSVGYRYPVAMDSPLPLVRRWTGGGLVQHDAEESTYSLVLPAHEPWSQRAALQSYEAVHRTLAAQLGPGYTLADTAGPEHSACFASWSQWDILHHGLKVAGAGQRRSRQGLLHQGSLRAGTLSSSFWQSFAKALAEPVLAFEATEALRQHAAALVEQRYSTAEWWRPSCAL